MAEIRTSESHPIIVDWLRTPWPGKVGLTFAPGQHGLFSLTGVWRRDLDMDLARLSDEYQTAMLVSLLEKSEYAALNIPDLLARASERGWQVTHFPIRDGHVPASRDDVTLLTSAIIEAATAGRNVVIHCRGGLGRTGTIAGCVLVAGGISPEDALKRVAETRGPNAPETTAQKQFIRDFADHLANTPRLSVE